MTSRRILAGPVLAVALATVMTGMSGPKAHAAEPAPVITSLSRHAATTEGGGRLVVTGRNLSGRPVVRFGQTPATVLTASSDRLEVAVPARAAGIVHVEVVTTTGSSTPSAATGFSFARPSGIVSDTTTTQDRPRVRGAAVDQPLDPALALCVTDALGLAPSSPVDAQQWARLESLNCADRGIASLDGLQQARNLRRLDVSRNRVQDLTPVQALVGLRELWVNSNQVSVLNGVGNLAELQVLAFSDNAVGSIAPLSRLTRLTDVLMDDNAVSALTPLASSTGLVSLEASFNRVQDLGPLSGLRSLRQLHLWGNQVSQLAPLAAMGQLQGLDLSGNSVSQLQPLAGLSRLVELNLEANRITNLAPLAGLTQLRSVNLDQNLVHDVQPLGQLKSLTYLFLRRNRITNLGPLSALPVRTIEATDQTITLPTGTAGWWPMQLRDRHGAALDVVGADARTPGVLRWPGAGARSARFSTADQTFTGTIRQDVRSATTQRFGDMTGDGWADVWTVRNGMLRLAPGGPSTLGAPAPVSYRKSSLTWVGRVHDLNADRQSDLLTRDAEGRLWYWPVLGPGHLGAPRQLASGWASMRLITVAGRLAGGSAQHLVAVDAAGIAHRWTVTASGLSAHRVIGTGFGTARAIVPTGDWNADGREDLAVLGADRRMRVHTTTSVGDLVAGRFLRRNPSSPAMAVVGKLSAARGPDLVWVDSQGRVLTSANSGARWAMSRPVASGWGSAPMLG